MSNNCSARGNQFLHLPVDGIRRLCKSCCANAPTVGFRDVRMGGLAGWEPEDADVAALRALIACCGRWGEAETTLKRINGLQDVIGTMLVGANGNVLRCTLPQDLALKYARKIPSLAAMARSGVRELDPQNDLQMLRIKSTLHEIIVIAEPLFTLLVVQNCKDKSSSEPSEDASEEDRDETGE